MSPRTTDGLMALATLATSTTWVCRARSRKLASLALGLLAVAYMPPVITEGQETSLKNPGAASGVDVVAVSRGQWSRWSAQFLIDGAPAARARRAAMEQLLRRYDLDESGDLDSGEASSLPSPFSMRQLAAGRIFLGVIAPPSDVDRDRDARISIDELGEYYDNGNAGVLIRWGTAPYAMELDAALAKTLRLQEAPRQWTAAVNHLFSCDANGDRLVSPGELMPGTTYPGTNGANLWAPGRGAAHCIVDVARPSERATGERARRILRQLERNESGAVGASDSIELEAESVVSLRKGLVQPAANHWVANCVGDQITLYSSTSKGVEPCDAPIWIRGESVTTRIHVSTSEDGARRVRDLAQPFLEQIRISKGRGASQEDFSSAPNRAEMARLHTFVDTNRDGIATGAELESWRRFTIQAMRSRLVLTILDFESSLFTHLDTSHDGSLSRAELNPQALDAVVASGEANEREQFSHRLPRHLRVVVSRGQPLHLLDSVRVAAPAWFAAMDRNHDGLVQREEFPGDDAKFQSFDRNKDGSIHPEEAD